MKRFCLVTLMLGLATAVPAQERVLAGRIVRGDDTTRGISDALVQVEGLGRARTSPDGRYSIPVGRSTSVKLLAQAIGFAPQQRPVTLSASGTTSLTIVLTPIPGQLATTVINGVKTEYPVRFADAYRRAKTANGRFFTKELIDSMGLWDVKALLATVPTVRVNDRSIDFAKCDAGLMGLGAGASVDPAASKASLGTGGRRNVVQVWVDGVRLTRAGFDSPERVVRSIPIQSIQIMEVYTGVSRIPAEFLEDACGVIAIWTRSY